MLSFGFYNSKGGDRKYDAEQIGAMFNGLITDGVFANYKEALRVTSGAGKREIVVRPGRAWFNGTWTEVDDGGHSIHLGTSFAVDDTFYICLAVSKKSRLNSIAYYKDIPENNPDTGLYYYLLAQINIPAGSDRIMDSMITDTRGSDLCPYVTGIMETVSFEELVKQVCGDSWQDWLGVYEAGITTGVQNAIRASSEALSEVKSLKAYSVESEAVSYTWAKFEAIATGGGGFEWATDSVHTELVDPPMPMCLFRDLSYTDLGAGFKPNISLVSPYKPDGETTTKPVPASTQAKVWKEYPYFWEGGGTYGTEVLRYDDLQRVIVTSAGVATEKYRYRISRLVHLPVTYEPGAYMGTVTADNATAYPRDGYKDGYWYKRFAAKAEDVSFYYPGLSAKNVQDAIIEVARTGGTGGGSAMSVIEVEELPLTGISGVMYVVKKSGDSDAVEYLWLDRWEKVGGDGSGQNINPVAKTEDMTQPVGVDADGRLWVAPIGGSTGGTETTTHGIVWNLVNVACSNPVASVSDGASLTAVLTAAEGYTLGGVTVTMGGEALTGVWNVDTATITITSVTGDVVISCAGVEQTGPADTTAKIAAYDKGYYWGSQIEAADYTGACVTEIYPYTNDIDKMKAHSSYDAENDCMTGTTMFPGITYYISNAKFIEAGNSVQSTRTKFAYARDGAFYGTGSVTVNAEKTTALGGKTNNDLYGNGVAFTLFSADVDDSYAYWSVIGSQIAPVGVRHGDVIFAGKNTPYYGMANIDGTMAGSGSAPETASVMSVDDDYAMDYGVSTLSLVTDDSASVATSTGLDVAYASAIEAAKNAWMVEANGNVDKIPLIIHTDQHGNFSKPLWDTVDKMVDWYEISKVANLGDTISAWADADADHPLTKSAELEAYLESMESVPYSKRIEVFGNHDTWKIVDGNTVGMAPQNHLRKYFKNIYARGKDNYGNMVVYDDRYNVKYLIISGMAYDSAIGGYSHYIIPSASWDWIIAQLEMADGYDVVVMSHVALGSGGAAITDPTGENNVTTCGNVDWVSRADFWGARKNKSAGSFTDQYGVSHAYDFSRCNSEILCGLHGHEHADGYYYVGNALLDVFFDAYYISPRAIHFVLIDRENRQLNVWKVDDTPQVQNYQVPLDKAAE